jgi:hypothetical protein
MSVVPWAKSGFAACGADGGLQRFGEGLFAQFGLDAEGLACKLK